MYSFSRGRLFPWFSPFCCQTILAKLMDFCQTILKATWSLSWLNTQLLTLNYTFFEILGCNHCVKWVHPFHINNNNFTHLKLIGVGYVSLPYLFLLHLDSILIPISLSFKQFRLLMGEEMNCGVVWPPPSYISFKNSDLLDTFNTNCL